MVSFDVLLLILAFAAFAFEAFVSRSLIAAGLAFWIGSLIL